MFRVDLSSRLGATRLFYWFLLSCDQSSVPPMGTPLFVPFHKSNTTSRGSVDIGEMRLLLCDRYLFMNLCQKEYLLYLLAKYYFPREKSTHVKEL